MVSVVSIALILLFPIVGLYFTKKRLSKVKFYGALMTSYWLLTIYLLLIHPGIKIFTIERIAIAPFVQGLLWTGIVIWAIREALPSVLTLTSKRYREISRNEKRSNLAPATSNERLIFFFVALTIGICEEVIWRRVMPELLQDLGATYWMGFVVAGVLFALGHFMQGMQGIVNGLVLAAVFTLTFLLSGSLLVSITLHFLYNYRHQFYK